MERPFFSIVIPVYQTEQYLEECLLSIKHQTWRDFECVVVDDGSLGVMNKGKHLGAKAIFEQTVGEDDRFRYIRQDNSGQGFARDAGIIQARGKKLVQVDSDDYLEPSFLQIAFDALARSDEQTLFFNQIKVLRDGAMVRFEEHERFVPAVNSFKSMLVFPTMMLTAVGYFFDIDFLHEHAIHYRYANKGEDTVFVFEYFLAFAQVYGCLPRLSPIPAWYVYRIRESGAAKQITRSQDFSAGTFAQTTAFVRSRLSELGKIGLVYYVLGVLFVIRFRLYAVRAQSPHRIIKFAVNVAVKTLTLVALLISGTRRRT